MSIQYWLNQTKYGWRYFVESIAVSAGIKKSISENAQLKKQKYFLNLDIKDYEHELGVLYKLAQRKECKFSNPVSFTEKIQWMKLYDSTVKKAELADKYRVREWIEKEIGAQYLIPLLGVWDNFDEIDFDALPDQFVLKCNHGAKMNIIVRDKKSFDKCAAKAKMDFWMQQDFGMCDGSFQLHYSLIDRKIIAEVYMEEMGSYDLKDYKFFCCSGKPMYCQVVTERTDNECVDFFDMDWNHMPFTGTACFKNSSDKVVCPQTFSLMKEFASKLSRDFSFVRVDFYEVDGKLYFGEMTFTPASGLGHFEPYSVDEEIGQLIVLPERKEIPCIRK